MSGECETGCAIDGCSRPRTAKGLCSAHRRRERKWGDPSIKYGQHAPVEDRFWSKVDAQGPCWEWTGARSSSGYGQIWVKPAKVVAHRFAYEQLVGPIPVGLQLDHLCRNRACVNPDHLQPVTQQINILRGSSVAAANHVKTHCPQGHEYTPENTYIHPKNNGRICRACARARTQSARQRKETS
jgi:hypothetical protein